MRRTNPVPALVVIETHGEMNQALQEPALGLPGRSPYFLEHFVALKELTPIEELDAFVKPGSWLPAHPRFCLVFTIVGSPIRIAAFNSSAAGARMAGATCISITVGASAIFQFVKRGVPPAFCQV